MNRKLCIKDIIIENVLRLVWFRELRRACDCTSAKVRVLQRLKSLRRILVRNYGFSESNFFVVCEDIWIAICPFYVVVVTSVFNTWKTHKWFLNGTKMTYFWDIIQIKLYYDNIMQHDAPLSPGVNPLEGFTLWSCGKLGLRAHSWLPTLEKGRGSCWESRD